MAIGKFDLSKIRAERVTQSHADNDMEFIDKMNSAKQGHRKLVKLPLSLLDANPHQLRADGIRFWLDIAAWAAHACWDGKK